MGTVEATTKPEQSAEKPSETRDALSVVDRRTGKSYELPITNGTVRAMDLRQIKTGAGRLRADVLRPGLPEHGLLHKPHHLHRRRPRNPALPRLPDRRAGREVHVPGGRLPPALRRAAQQGAVRAVGPRHHLPHHDPREPQEGHGRIQLRRAPDGDADLDRRGDVHVLPGSPRRPQRRRPHQADPPADRQDADDRGLRLQAQHGHAVRLSLQCHRLQRELPDDALQDSGRGLPAEPGRSSARWTCSSSSTPTTSRTAAPTRCGASARRTPIRTRLSRERPRRSTVRCTAARTKKSCGCCGRSARWRTCRPSSRRSRKARARSV